jgi:hypothetical protein
VFRLPLPPAADAAVASAGGDANARFGAALLAFQLGPYARSGRPFWTPLAPPVETLEQRALRGDPEAMVAHAEALLVADPASAAAFGLLEAVAAHKDAPEHAKRRATGELGVQMLVGRACKLDAERGALTVIAAGVRGDARASLAAAVLFAYGLTSATPTNLATALEAARRAAAAWPDRGNLDAEIAVQELEALAAGRSSRPSGLLAARVQEQSVVAFARSVLASKSADALATASTLALHLRQEGMVRHSIECLRFLADAHASGLVIPGVELDPVEASRLRARAVYIEFWMRNPGAARRTAPDYPFAFAHLRAAEPPAAPAALAAAAAARDALVLFTSAPGGAYSGRCAACGWAPARPSPDRRAARNAVYAHRRRARAAGRPDHD